MGKLTVLSGENLRCDESSGCLTASASFPCDRVQVSPIQVLFSGCRPSAIARLVRPVVIDAVERFALGSLAHVLQEGFERSPVVAYGDASSAVQVEVQSFRVPTAFPHRSPRVVRPRSDSTYMRVTVDPHALAASA